MHIQVNVGEPPPPLEAAPLRMEAHHINPLTGEDEGDGGDLDMARIRALPTGPVDPNDPRTWGKVQRNALCPCGSGRKFKHCHGALV